MAVWPTDLPPPALNTLRESPPDNVLRSSMDKGPAKLRRRTTANTRPISFELNLTPAEVQTLDDFYTTTLFSGVDAFDMDHPRTGDPVSVRFVERPAYVEREGIDYRVSINLEIMP